MKWIFPFLIFLSNSNIFSQTIPDVYSDELKLNIKEEVTGKNLNGNQSKSYDEFPFQFGVEGGIPVKIFGNNFLHQG